MYKEILNKVVLCLFNKNAEMVLYDFLIHIYLYLLFFYENKSLNINSIDSYNKLITVFIPFIKSKFNYKLNAISYDKYESLIDKNNINLIFETETETKTNFNDIIYDILKTTKELKIYSKEMKSLFTKQNVIEYINKLYNDYVSTSKTTIRTKDNLILNLFSGSGNLINCLINNLDQSYSSDQSNQFNPSNITLCDNNEFMNIIAYANLKMNTGNEFSNIIKTDILHDNNINSEYDVIISDLPDDIRNIIHANCCNKIKQFKIRGTKSEPLILQLVMSLLNQNGIAFIIVPDSMLFSDSNQHIETRKYLLENFKLEKVINIEDKKSILMFTNNGKTSSIQFSSMLNDYNLTVNIDIIKTKNSSFYYYNYENNINVPIKSNISNDKCQKLGQIINILNTFPKTNNSELVEYLVCYKTNLFKIMKAYELKKSTKSVEIDYVFEVNNNDQYSQNYINYYLLNLFNKNLNNISKGKIKQLDIDVIKNLNIYIPQYSLQIEIINTIEYNNKIIELNKIQINNYEQLKLNYLSNIISSISTDKLVNMCKISHDSVSSNTIVINRNSNMAGTISLTVLDNESTTNNYYLEPDTSQINNTCLYYILKLYESKLKEMSKANNTINLSRTKLENIEIPVLSSKDSILIEKCLIFDEKIKQLIIMNEQLEIMSLF
jgi:hypothetical protein